MRTFAFGVVACLGVVGACGDDGSHEQVDLDTTIDSAPAALTNDPTAVIHFHSTPAGDDFVCQLDGAAPVQCHDPFTMTVGDGAHTFSVATLGDKAALDTTPAMAAWTVDTVAPDTAITAQPAAVDNSVAPAFAFSGTDTGPAGALTFACAIDGGAFAACTSPHTVPVTDGDHTFAVRATDAAGNVDASPATFAWVVDTSTPDTSIDSGPADAATTGPTATFAFSSPTTADATFECALDGAAFASCTSPVAAAALAGGAHTFVVRAKDAHGVVDPSPAMRAWTVDATPPDIAITTKPSDPSNDTTPVFGFTSADATATFACQVEGTSTFTACTSGWRTSALGAGPQVFDVRATDPYGNSATASYGWTIDVTGPTVAITSGPIGATATNRPSFGFTVTGGGPASPRCALDTGAAADCTSPYAPGTLADGAHAITVTATDAAGNTGSASRAFTVDTTPPVVTFTAAPVSPSNDATPTWAFTTDTPGATTTCKLDAGAAAPCAATFTSGALADGNHVLTVAATDAVGNTGAATASVTIDTVKPVVAFTGGPADPTPTKQTRPAFTFTVSEGTAACVLDSFAAVACTTTFTPGSALADGAHTLTVTATDAAGNTGSATRAFTVDTTPPIITFTALPATPTNDPTPSWSFTTDTAGAALTCKVDGGTAAACTSPFTAATLADGAHTLTVAATDVAGNTGTATSPAVTIDTAKPTVAFTSGPQNPTPTNVKTPAFGFTISDGTATCAVDGGTAVACATSFTTASLGDGAHHIIVTATDAAGNTGSARRDFTVDTAPPVITFTALPATPTTDTTPSWSFSTDTAGATLTCRVDTNPAAACTSPFTAAALADGAHTLTVAATDAAGNTGTATSPTVTIDTMKPTVAFTSGPQDPTPTNVKTPAFGFTISEGTATCAVDGGTAVSCATSFTTASLGDGAHTIVVTATDAAGNTGSARRDFTVDTTPPTVMFTGGPTDPTPTNQSRPAFTFTTSGGALSPQRCTIDTGTAVDCTNAFTPATALADGPHTLFVAATDAAGNTGTSSRSFTVDTAPPGVTITSGPLDPNAPTNSTTPSFTFSVTAGPATTQCTIDGGAPATCASSGGITATGTYTTPALAAGTHTLTVTATDTAGNVATTPPRSFTIDRTAPAVVFTGGPIDPTPTTSRTPAFTLQVSETATILCSVDGGATTDCTSLSYTTASLADGGHTVAAVATDRAGNTGSTSRAFTVDATAPAITFDDVPPAQWPVNYYTPKWHASETATFLCSTDGTAFAACTSGGSSYTFPYGADKFFVRAKDTAGNTATSSAGWSSATDLVWHFPWEQGSLDNTSLLAQRPAYSTSGAPQATPTMVGGWAGTAQQAPGVQTYANTQQALSSSVAGAYTATVWVRPGGNDNGTVWSNVSPTAGGISVAITSTRVLVRLFYTPTASVSASGSIVLHQWNSIAVRTTGTGKGIDLFINGVRAGVNVNGTTAANGFGANQASALTVGPISDTAVDDLRFYNFAFTDAEMCDRATRGWVDPNFTCHIGAPMMELAFEGNLLDTGTAHMTTRQTPAALEFPFTDKLGQGLFMGNDTLSETNFVTTMYAGHAHTISFWVSSKSVQSVFDATTTCGGNRCGFTIIAGGRTGAVGVAVYNNVVTGNPATVTLTATAEDPPTGPYSVVLVETNAEPGTKNLAVYVDGVLESSVDFPTGAAAFDMFGVVGDLVSIRLNGFLDEFQVWQSDLSLADDTLCENGFDGQWDPASGQCTMTANF